MINGRIRECALIDELLARARDSHGGALVVRGDRTHRRAVIAVGAELAPGRLEDQLPSLAAVAPWTPRFHQS